MKSYVFIFVFLTFSTYVFGQKNNQENQWSKGFEDITIYKHLDSLKLGNKSFNLPGRSRDHIYDQNFRFFTEKPLIFAESKEQTNQNKMPIVELKGNFMMPVIKPDSSKTHSLHIIKPWNFSLRFK